MQHITRERDRARQERDRADRMTQFMTGIFEVPGPGEGRRNSITAREILDDASHEISTSLNKDPELQAKMMVTLAQSYADLGIYSRAQPLVE